MFPLFSIYYFQNKRYKNLINDLKLSNNSCFPTILSKNNKSSNVSNKSRRDSKCSLSYIKYMISKLFGVAFNRQVYSGANNVNLDMYNMPYIDKSVASSSQSMIKKLNENEKFLHDEKLNYDCDISEKTFKLIWFLSK